MRYKLPHPVFLEGMTGDLFGQFCIPCLFSGSFFNLHEQALMSKEGQVRNVEHEGSSP